MHFHYVLSMGAVFALFSAWYYWMPKIVGLDYNIMLAKVHFWVFFIGVWLKKRPFYFSHNKKWGLCPYSEGKRPPRGNFVMFFENIDKSKLEIYKSLRNKSGVYMFINNITTNTYIGSSINLTNRMTSHFYNAKSASRGKTIINKAMYKHKLANFSLGILGFCSKDPITCTTLEQKWIDLYKPEYNVLKIAGSSFGFTHTVQTISKLKNLFKKEFHPKFGYTTSPETVETIRHGIKKFYLNNSHPFKGKTGKLSPQYGIGGSMVFCYNQNDKELIFPSINAAKQHFKIRWTTIKKNIDTKQHISIKGENWIIQSFPRDTGYSVK